MSSPLVSCIVPVHNGERFLAAALDSIRSQTHRPIEAIVVDDGSTDASAELAERHPVGARVLRQENRGLPASRNAGLRAATGDLIAHLDADDLWLPEKLERQLARLAEAPELDGCMTHFQNFWEPELAEETARLKGHPLTRPMSGLTIPTLLARRACVERFGPFDETQRGAADALWLFWARHRGARFEVLPDVLMRRRIHGSNDSRARGHASTFQLAKARIEAGRSRTARHGTTR